MWRVNNFLFGWQYAKVVWFGEYYVFRVMQDVDGICYGVNDDNKLVKLSVLRFKWLTEGFDDE